MISVPQVVKDLYHQDHAYKNIRIHFPNGERSDICNDLIVKDSVSFKESLCSQNTLKFGLCESPIFECEVVGVGNIKGATVEISIEIECPASTIGAEWRADIQKYVYSIPYGVFVIDECTRQADLNHRKIKAFTIGINGTISKNPFFNLLQNTILDVQPTTYTIDLATLACCLSNVNRDNSLIESTTELTNFNTGSIETIHLHSTHAGYDMTCWAMMDTYRIPYSHRGNLFYLESTPYISSCIQEYFDNINRIKNQSEYRWDEYEPKRYFDMESIYKTCFFAELTTTRTPNLLVNQVFPLPDYSYICPKLDLGYEEYIYEQPSSQPKFASVREFRIRVTKGYGAEQIIVEDITIPVRKPGDSFRVFEATIKNDIFHHTLSVNRVPYSIPQQSRIHYILDPQMDFSGYLSAYVELLGMFCGWKRDGYNFVNIRQQFGLPPQSSLYPSPSLYPQRVTGGKLYPEDYRSCWYDDYYTKKYGSIVCKFKTVETVEGESKVVDATYTLYLNGFNEESDPLLYAVYEIKDNKIINDKVAVIEEGEIKYVDKTWTPQQIEDICSGIAANLENVSYIPVEFTGRGLPYVEAGDTFEILTKSNDSITTIVLNRTITGEQTLKDSYKSV